MPLRVLKDIKKIYAGLNADAIRAAAWKNSGAGLMVSGEAADSDEYRRMEEFLAPQGTSPGVRAQALQSMHRNTAAPLSCDFVLCGRGVPVPRNGFLFDPADGATLARMIVAEGEQNELAIARTFPGLRRAVALRIINRVARENALFSLVTALPNVVPNLLELPWAVGEFATDTAFITMNQIRMALTIAAAHGRQVGYGEQKTEIVAIAAGAFGWRAIARELVGKIPLGGGLIPKAAVSFAGTYVVGLGLEKLNRTGTSMSRSERRDAYADAFEKGKEAARELSPVVLQTR